MSDSPSEIALLQQQLRENSARARAEAKRQGVRPHPKVAAPRKKLPPGHCNQFEERAQVVDNPYAVMPDPLRDKALPPEPKGQVVTVNVRETPIAHMFARGDIDLRLSRAADKFRSLCEAARRMNGVIDPARIRVDVSGNQYSVADATLDACRMLDQLAHDLGVQDFDILKRACDVGQTVTEITVAWYTIQVPGSRMEKVLQDHTGQRLKDALNRVANRLGMSGKPRHDDGKVRFYRCFAGELTADSRDWSTPPDALERRAANKQRRRQKKS